MPCYYYYYIIHHKVSKFKYAKLPKSLLEKGTPRATSAEWWAKSLPTQTLNKRETMSAQKSRIKKSIKRDRRCREETPNPRLQVPQRGAYGRCGRTHAKDSCPAVGIPKVQESKPRRQHVQNKRTAGARGQR